MTSFRIVSKVRGILNSRLGLKAKDLKVGHAGTLDPLASGVLIVCTGKATKQIDELQAGTKEYIATLKLGATTPSFDRETAEDTTYPFAHITRELVEATLPKFLGRIEQIPPRFSAVKVDGKRAFKLARKGVEMELKPKILVIDEIELLSCQLEPPTPTKNQPQMTDGADSIFKPQAINIKSLTPELIDQFQKENEASSLQYPSITIRIVCSKGTYIRALARDIGEALGSGAYLTSLCRTRIGNYTLQQSLDINDFESFVNSQEIEIISE